MANSESIYSSIQNLYNMNKTTWQEVLAELYNLVYDIQTQFEQVETKFNILLGEEVTNQIKEMYYDGTLEELINDTLLSDINNKVDNFVTKYSDQIDNKALKIDLETEKNRIDNLIINSSEGTEKDSELIDGRVGADSVTYTTLGNSIRSQVNNLDTNVQQLREFVSNEGSINITFTEHTGYLKADGTFANDETLHCKITNRIYCNEGWVFYYYGNANALAVSYIMYKGNKIVQTGQYSLDESKVNITIPNGIDNIVFATYGGISTELKIEVKLIEPKILNKENLIENLNNKIKYSELNVNLKNCLPKEFQQIFKSEMTENVGYLTSGGGVNNDSNYKYYEIEVNENEVYDLKVYLIYAVAPFQVCDSNGKSLLYDNTITYHNNATLYKKENITIPKGGKYLRVCSYIKGGEGNIYLYKHILSNIYNDNQLSNFIDNHKFDGYGDYIEITNNFTLINGAFLTNGGGLSTNNISQYTDYIDIDTFTSLYVDGYSRYLTCHLCVYDSSFEFLGYDGYSSDGDAIIWNKYRVNKNEILNNYPTAKFIRLGSYLIESYPLKIYKNGATFKEIISANSNILYGKKYVACGDSFVAGDFNGYTDENGLSGKNSPVIFDSKRNCYKTYPWWIAERNNMTLINEAINGSTMALSKEYLDGTTSDINYRSPFSLNRYKEIPTDTDYMTICFGLNETSTALGSLADDTNTTVLGAWNVVLKYFRTNLPYCKIGIIISDGWLSDTFANAIISVAEYWGYPYLDLRNNPLVPCMIGGRGGNINLSEEAKTLINNAYIVSSTNFHPNLEAHKQRSTVIENFMRSL